MRSDTFYICFFVPESPVSLSQRLPLQQRRAEVQEGGRRGLPGHPGDQERQHHPAHRGHAGVFLQQVGLTPSRGPPAITQPYLVVTLSSCPGCVCLPVTALPTVNIATNQQRNSVII